MKRLAKRNICMSSWCQVVAICIFASQIIHLVDAQSTTDATTTDSSDHSTELSANAKEGDCPMCNLSEMPMELADKINEISDMDVFVHDFVDSTNSLLTNTSSLDFHPANRRKRAAANNLRQATCQPIDTLISTVPADERDPSVFYFPSCVLVKQCGGCCAHSGTICTAIEEVEKTVAVKKSKYVNQSKLMNLGDVTMTVKEHNKCKCLCKKTQADCTSLQRFIKNQCRCECMNKDDEEQCVKSYPQKLFDSTTCQCVCRETKDCGFGYHFDQGSCSCKQSNYDEVEDFPLFGGHGQENETYEATDDVKYDTIPTETAEATSEE